MTILRNSFDNGTLGQPVSVGNSVLSGDAFDATNPVVVYSDVASHGSLGVVVEGPTTEIGALRWPLGGAKRVSARCYLHLNQPVVSDQGVIRITAPGASTINVAQFLVSHLGRARVNLAGAVTAWHDTADFPTNQWIRVEIHIDQGSGTTTGSLRAAYYLGDSLVPIGDSGLLTGLDLNGAGNGIDFVRFGKNATNEYTGNFRLDSLAVNTEGDSSGFIGPHVTKLATPEVSLQGSTQASSGSATDGSLTVSWPSVQNASSYRAEIADGYDASTGFVVRSSNATSPYTFTNLGAGQYTVAITAVP